MTEQQQRSLTAAMGRRGITKRRMQQILDASPDSVVFVVPGYDHNYRPAGAEASSAWLDPDGTLSEYCEDESVFDESGVRIPVIVIQ